MLILRHPDDSFDEMPYVIQLLADQWRAWGLRVDISATPNHRPKQDTLVIPHLDVTKIPAEFQGFFNRCPLVLNRNVHDISKRSISTNLVQSPEEFDGPVIVKTNLNAGGEPEKRRLRKRMTGKAWLKLAGKLPWSMTGMLGIFDYRVFDHASLVPRIVWRNPRLVVEKFLPEKQDGLYCIRQYIFFGSREMNTLAMGPSPIVKARNVTRREVLSSSPPELQALRASLGFDFGKFDYVLRDGKPVLLDANRTPTYNPASKAGSPSQLLLDLAKGIDAFGECSTIAQGGAS